MKVIIRGSDAVSGSMFDGKFHVSLPGYLTNTQCMVTVESLVFSDPIPGITYNMHIKEFVDMSAYSSMCGGCSDVVLSGNTSTPYMADVTKDMHGAFRIPAYMLRNGLLSVYFTLNAAVRMGGSYEYPPAAMNSNATTLSNQAYGNGQYSVAATSSDVSMAPWHVFNKVYGVPSVYSWRSSFASTNAYNTNTGNYTGTALNNTVVDGITYYGEYMTMTLPQPIQLTTYSLTTNFEYDVRGPNTWLIAGSSNGTNWTLLDTKAETAWNSANETRSFVPNVGNSNAFDRFRMLTTRVGNPGTTNYRSDWGMAEMRLFGSRKYFSDWTLTLDVQEEL